jgi:hypothetical protein
VLAYSTACLALAMATLAGCGLGSERNVEKTLTDQIQAPALVFDLEESPVVAVGLSLPSNGKSSELRSIALPFGTEASLNRPEMMTAWGSRDGVTLVTYLVTPAGGATSLVSLKPVFETATDPDFVRIDLPGSMYYMTSGLKRRFFYQGPSDGQRSSHAWTDMVSIASSTVDTIVVKLPAAAEIFEAPSKSRVPISSADTPHGKVKIFADAASAASAAGPVDIVYQVPPSSGQQQIADWAIKFFIAILTPLVGFLGLDSTKVTSRKGRLIVIWTLGSIAMLALLGALAWGIYTRSIAGYAILGDLGVAVFGGVCIWITAHLKGQS